MQLKAGEFKTLRQSKIMVKNSLIESMLGSL